MKIDNSTLQSTGIFSSQFVKIGINKVKKTTETTKVFEKDKILNDQQVSNLQTYSSDSLNSLQSIDNKESELLRKAMSSDKMDVVDLLIKYSNNNLGLPAIYYAVYVGDLEAVKTLLPLTDVEKCFAIQIPHLNCCLYSANAMCIASVQGHQEIYDLLKKNGAKESIDYLQNNCSVLCCNAKEKTPLILKKALELGAISDPTSVLSKFLDDNRFIDKPWYIESIKILIKNKANCSFSLDSKLYHPYFKCMKDFKYTFLLKPAATASCEITKMLLDNGALHLINEGYWTYNPLISAIGIPLGYAHCGDEKYKFNCYEANLDLVKLLVDHGAMLNEKDEIFKEIIKKITIHKEFDVFMALPQLFNDIDAYGSEIFCCAIESNNIDFIKWAIKKNVNLNKISSFYGKSFLQYAIDLKRKEIAAILLQNGAKI